MSVDSHDIKEISGSTVESDVYGTQKAELEDQSEVFRRGEGQIDFRTVSWIRAGIIFLKGKPSLIFD